MSRIYFNQRIVKDEKKIVKEQLAYTATGRKWKCTCVHVSGIPRLRFEKLLFRISIKFSAAAASRNNA